MDKIKKNIKAYLLFSNYKLKKAISFKGNFITEIIGMALNNVAMFIAWLLLFQNFGSINGYDIYDIVLIHGILQLMYGIVAWNFGGILKLYQMIYNDTLIDNMLYPVNPLSIIFTKGGNPSNFGDLVFGVMYLTFYSFHNPESIFILITSIIIILFGFIGVSIFFSSLLFYFPSLMNFVEDLLMQIYIGAGLYPSKFYDGLIKIILYITFLIPVISIPIEVIRNQLSISNLAISIITIFLVNVIGYLLWNKGLKRVESGSGSTFVD